MAAHGRSVVIFGSEGVMRSVLETFTLCALATLTDPVQQR
jgi:hypothetical protein